MLRTDRRLERLFNLPNQLTTLRLLLSVVLFCLIAWELVPAELGAVRHRRGHRLARRLLRPEIRPSDHAGANPRPVRRQGDRLRHVHLPGGHSRRCRMPWGLQPWMVVVIVGRELLVTALRSFIEERGCDFSAKMSGKLKMVLQCVAAGRVPVLSLLRIH